MFVRELPAINLHRTGGWRRAAANYAKDLPVLHGNVALKALVQSATMVIEPLFAFNPLAAEIKSGEAVRGYPKLNFVENATLTPKIVTAIQRTKGERPINMLVLDYCADNYFVKNDELIKYYHHDLGLGFLKTLCHHYSSRFALGYMFLMDNDWKSAVGMDHYCREQVPPKRRFGDTDEWWDFWSALAKTYNTDSMRFAFFVQISKMQDAEISLHLDVKPSGNNTITAFERSLQAGL